MSYFESRLKVEKKSENDLKKKLEFCNRLGIKNVILEFDSHLSKKYVEKSEEFGAKFGVKCYFRVNLLVNKLNEYRKQIRQFKSFPYIVSVESINKQIQLKAAKDSRVDIVSFSEQKILKTLTPGLISLSKQNNSFIEFSLGSLMIDNLSLQSKNFRNLYRSLQLVKNLSKNYIISGNFTQIFDMRHPRNLISICNTLLELPIADAKRAFQDNILAIINKVNARANNKLLEDGIKLVEVDDN